MSGFFLASDPSNKFRVPVRGPFTWVRVIGPSLQCRLSDLASLFNTAHITKNIRRPGAGHAATSRTALDHEGGVNRGQEPISFFQLAGPASSKIRPAPVVRLIAGVSEVLCNVGTFSCSQHTKGALRKHAQPNARSYRAMHVCADGSFPYSQRPLGRSKQQRRLLPLQGNRFALQPMRFPASASRQQNHSWRSCSSLQPNHEIHSSPPCTDTRHAAVLSPKRGIGSMAAIPI